MSAQTTHFRVGNGDMMLVEFESGRKLIVDINIREAADDPDDDTPDVAEQLRSRLSRESKGRLYVRHPALLRADRPRLRAVQLPR
jgi:hypothetical protein